MKNTLSAQGIADASHLRSAIQQALISFGAVPDLPSDVAKNAGLDTAGTAALAQGNPFSVLAQLAQKYNLDQESEKNQLAARGILSSGETGYQLGKLGQANALGQYNATNALLGSIGTLNDQYVAGRNAAAQALAQGASTAEQNQVGMNPAGTGSLIATYDPATKTWVDPSGQHYTGTQNPDGTWTGTPVSAPAGGWPTASTGTAPTPPAGTTTTDQGTGTPTPPAAAPPPLNSAGGWAPGVTPPTLYQPGQIVRPGAGVVG